MLQEIEVQGIGTMRELNDWQQARVRNIRSQDRILACIAFSLGMSLRQFKRLTREQQNACWDAFNQMTAPPPIREEQVQRARLLASHERVPLEKQITMGKELIAMKAKLPHGHFWPWVRQKSGINVTQARRFIRAANSVATSDALTNV